MRAVGTAVLAAWLGLAAAAAAQDAPPEVRDGRVQLDFNDVEISVVIDTIARLTGKNFIYDDRVRGRVTIVSPTEISVDQAYAVFESVLQVKGFTVVEGPGGALKVIPIREAKESSIETIRGPTPDSDRYITRLIPLRFIDAEAITNTLKPLVSKDASMVAYPPTNTVILTDAASNIRRILDIIEEIDVESYKEDLAVIKVEHADAATLADQLSEIFGAEVSEAAQARTVRSRRRAAQAAQTGSAEVAAKGEVRLITDERTNSLIVLASRQRLIEIREVIRKLDVPVPGGGRIHVHFLRHADAEELAQTLNALITGQPAAPVTPTAGVRGAAAPTTPQALRAAVTELAEGVTVTADPPTNSLVIQASKEGFSTLRQVIEMLDVARPQVLVEALIMEVDITDGQELGFNGLVRIFNNGDQSYAIGSLTDAGLATLLSGSGNGTGNGNGDGDGDGDGDGELPDSLGDVTLGDAQAILLPILTSLAGGGGQNLLGVANAKAGTTLIQGVIRASASLGGANIISAPHILTSDNEEAEIKVGNEIPIVTSRVQSAQGQDVGLATSQNIERQDIGVTLRVTPQISEGNTVRLDIFQEITDINLALSAVTGNPEEVGVSLSSRTVENTVVVADEETVVIGGLISDDYTDTVSKIPWLGDIPILGWLFKSTKKDLTKTNLLVFLTPHIVRTAEEMEEETIRKREEFWSRSEQALELTEKEKREAEEREREAAEAGLGYQSYVGRNPVRAALVGHADRYPLERMREIEEAEAEARRQAEAEAEASARAPAYAVLAAVLGDEGAAVDLLTELVDGGFDGSIVTEDAGGALLYHVRLGPYASIEEAEHVVSVVEPAYGLTPTVVVERAP